MNKKQKLSDIPRSIQKQIQEIQNDSIHGSTFITKKAIVIIESYLNLTKKQTSFSAKNIQQILLSLVQAQPNMALLLNFSNQFLTYIDQINNQESNQEKYKQSIQNFLEQFYQNLNQTNKTISTYALKYLKSVSPIALYSDSSTIQETIQLLAKQNKNLTIYCAESRPKNEGTNLAQSLAKKQIPVSLMTDATLFSKISETEAVLIGADAISYRGITNKIGSYPLCQLAEQYDIDIFCLTNSYKILPYNFTLSEESKKPFTDIINKKNKKIDVINYYFDKTPLKLITGIITEKGFFTSNEVKKQIRGKKLHSYLKNKLQT